MLQGNFVQVLLSIPLDQDFTYRIPDGLVGRIQPGSRVLVPFGPRKILSGIAIRIHQTDPGIELKEVLELLDPEPVINDIQIRFWEWMSDYYLCTPGEVMKAALPAGLRLESNTRLFTVEDFETEDPLTEIEELAWLYLRRNEGCSIQELGEALKRKNPLPVIHALNSKGAVVLEEKLSEGYRPRMEIFYRMNPDYQDEQSLHQLLNDLEKAPRQKQILEILLAREEQIQMKGSRAISKKVLKHQGGNPVAADALVKKEILLREKTETSRWIGDQQSHLQPADLNPEQQQAFETIRQAEADSVHLLHGITSSGKTEVFIHLIREVLKQKKQVLYLLPEIALTEQIINRLTRIFGNQVGVFHSRYADSEKVELWKDLLKSESRFSIVLGARSALFLPFSSLALIIVDEEHESSFKQQDPAPRYHARDAAIVLAKMHGAKVVLGTATPSLESYTNCISGKYQLHELKTRFGNIPLPEVIIANAAEAHRKKKIRGHLTPELLQAVDDALVNGEQVILFQNRRGYSPFVECDTCGHVPKCRFCDVSLTLHQYKKKLTCHYCGYAEPVTNECPACHNRSLRTKGLGTEGLEDEISMLFPKARLARLDLETTRTRKSYIRILDGFEKGHTDILIGTQMVTKGLDFSNVRVVGIINADNLLHFPDFRSFERSFQLMTQVSGRAGRRADQGLVIIQTYDPGHRIIKQVVQHNFQALYQAEIKDRRDFYYPPFSRLIRISLKHKDPELVNRCAYYLAKELRSKWENQILGPQAPVISRIQNQHIRQILIKSAKGQEHRDIRNHIRSILLKLKSDKTFRPVTIQPDVDPF